MKSLEANVSNSRTPHYPRSAENRLNSRSSGPSFEQLSAALLLRVCPVEHLKPPCLRLVGVGHALCNYTLEVQAADLGALEPLGGYRQPRSDHSGPAVAS